MNYIIRRGESNLPVPVADQQGGMPLDLKPVQEVKVIAHWSPPPVIEKIYDDQVDFNVETSKVTLPGILWKREGLVGGVVEIHHDGNIVDSIPFEFKVVSPED